jgi:hypothetical protein
LRGDIIPDNPSAGIKVDAVKDKEPRKLNFSPDDLSRLFGEHFVKDGKWGERQWAMVIALFTGMIVSLLRSIFRG